MQSTYGSDFCSTRRGKPTKQLPMRPTSTSRRNNPHPPPDFPDTQVLSELRRELSKLERTARARDAALSKRSFVDELLRLKKAKDTQSQILTSENREAVMEVLSKVDINLIKSLLDNDRYKTDPVYGGYPMDMGDHFY